MWKSAPLRSILIIYALALVAGVCEFCGMFGKKNEPDIYGSPIRNFPEAMSRLYPGRSETEYLIGRRLETRAGRSHQPNDSLPEPERRREFMEELKADLGQAVQHYERAMELGLISEENLYYNYALTLIRMQAEPEKIDRAILAWRLNFPFSDRPDLDVRRRSIEEKIRQLTGGREAEQERANSVANRLERNVKQQSKDSVVGGSVGNNPQFDESSIEWRADEGYVGSAACRNCHSDQFKSYLETSHSRSLAEIDVDLEPVNAEFDHTVSGRRFRVTRHDRRLIHQECLLLEGGHEYELTSVPQKYRVGSGHFARTYLCDGGGGFLFESPLTWYESAQAWAMTPGFDRPNHRSFTRHVVEDCLACHAGRFQRSTQSDFRLQIVENSIGCERCHGPGERHVTARTAGQAHPDSGDPTIVNPRRLTRKLADGVCQQCHLQSDIHIGGWKLRASDYRPGQPLEQFSTVYRLTRNSKGMTVVGHVEQLAESACHQKSETLTCVTCHNPHITVARADQAAHYRDVCSSCHRDPGCGLALPVREEKAQNDCVHCHMPKSATEVPHLAFTHHRIGVHPMQPASPETANDDLLVPVSNLAALTEFERTRSLMLARTQAFLLQSSEYQRSEAGQQLRGQIQTWLDELPAMSVDGETEFARSQFLLACGDLSGASRSATKALAREDIRSEEAVALLEQRGLLDYRDRRYEQSRNSFQKLVQLRRQGQDWYYLGMCEWQSGRPEVAARALETARVLQPARVEIQEALRDVYRAVNDVDAEQELLKDIDRLRRRVPPRP